ncbi:MAG TPA: hypothetical protein VFH78_09395 [Candidatus Thermoplasmatota archaeon]|nr:hypothetical protein [Candidatus Thermoplasmatota archaeon]
MSEPTRPGHGDHWLAALEQGDPRLRDVLAVPLDAPDSVQLHRTPLNAALDMVQVTAKRRLITAYPEPRATALVTVRPRELLLWDTRVEGWLVAEHEGAGALTVFLTDLVENAKRYQEARGAMPLELAGLAYSVRRPAVSAGPTHLRPARQKDERFLPDDYWFEGEIRSVLPSRDGVVLDLALQNGLELPVVSREDPRLAVGERAQGFLWLTGRWPEGH